MVHVLIRILLDELALRWLQLEVRLIALWWNAELLLREFLLEGGLLGHLDRWLLRHVQLLWNWLYLLLRWLASDLGLRLLVLLHFKALLAESLLFLLFLLKLLLFDGLLPLVEVASVLLLGLRHPDAVEVAAASQFFRLICSTR